jgi:hypothetical protein
MRIVAIATALACTTTSRSAVTLTTASTTVLVTTAVITAACLLFNTVGSVVGTCVLTAVARVARTVTPTRLAWREGARLAYER